MSHILRSLIAFAVFLSGSLACAQDWPARPIHVIAVSVPGSGADVLTRFFAEKLRAYTLQPMIIENKAGALGSIAGEAAARARPDGYTMLFSGYPALSANALLLRNITYDPIKDLAPVATLFEQPFILTVGVNSPIRSVKELTTHLKAKGDKGSYASVASSSIALSELYMDAEGLKTLQVGFRDAALTLNEMTSGTIDFAFHDPIFSVSQIREGRLRGLAVSTPKRAAAVPDLPTMAEAGVPAATFTSWWAVVMPANTPGVIIAKMNGWLNEILATEDAKKFIASFGAEPLISTPDVVRKLQVEELERWKTFVRIAKIEPQ